MHGLKYGSCRFRQRTDLPPNSNMHGLKSGSCRFWQRTDLPPGSNMLRAEIQRALRRAPRQLRRLARLANSPGFKSFHCPRWRIKFSLERFSDPSRYSLRAQPLKVLSGEFRRRPTALVINFLKSDRVGRRGLSEPREDFSRLFTDAIPRLCPWIDSAAVSVARQKFAALTS